jgi:iron complex outermembrane recepter protein
LLVRASYGTGFRAGSISNLYGGTMQSFTNYTDPCDINFGLTANPTVEQRCLNGFANLKGVGPGFTQLTSAGVSVGGPNGESASPYYTGANPNLRPETSKSMTAGFVYSPNWLTGFNITADFYRIRVDNVITLPSATSILDNCYLLGETQQCGQFQRSSTGQVINLLQAVTNAGFIDERGTDLTLSYLFPDTPVGKFKIDTSGTYISSLKEQDTPIGQGGMVSWNLGAYDPILGPVWRFRDTTNLNWSYGSFGATWTLRYYSSLQESCHANNALTAAQSLYFPCDDINGNVQGASSGLYRQGATTFNDFQFSWTAPWKGQISVGSTNIFNRRTQFSYTGVQSVIGPLGPTGTDGYTGFSYNPQYDIGRVVYLKYTQQLF